MSTARRTRRAAALLLVPALLAALTACDPADPFGNSVAEPTAAPSETAAPVDTELLAVPQVANPWKKGMKQLGVNVYWEDIPEDSDEVTRAKIRRIIDHLISLNVNSVAINFPYFMGGKYWNSVGPLEGKTPSPQRVEIFLEEAQASRMRVAIRPIMDEQALLPTWRGAVKPTDRDQWFASYAKFLASYGAVAEKHDAAEMVIGVELNSLQGDKPHWKKLMNTVHKSFSGELAYSMNFDSFQLGEATPPADSIGVDAYFHVIKPDDTPVKTLTTAWLSWLDKYAGDTEKELVLHEAGIAAQDGAFHKPAQWGTLKVPLNLAVQSNWYSAVCTAVKQRDLAGVYFWNIRLHANPGAEDPKQSDRLTFVDRPAEKVLKRCFASLGGAE